MVHKRHGKGTPRGGQFALVPVTPPPSAHQAPSEGKECQRCKAPFQSPDKPWAYLCADCSPSDTTDLHALFLQRVTPLEDPGQPLIEALTTEEPEAEVASEGLDVNLAQYKGLGKFDYLLVEGEHYDVVQDTSMGTSFRRLNENGRREFAKLITRLGPPHDWPAPIKEFIEENGIPASAVPAGRSSMEFHIVSLLAAHPEYAFERDDLTEFRRAYSGWYKRRENVTPRPRASALNSKGDPIQQVNKSGQWGLQHQTVYFGSLRQPYYMLRPPFTFLASARNLRKAQPLDPSDRDSAVALVKSYLYENFINVPAYKWEQGHANPEDDSPAVWQPGGYQRSRRDRFVFDEYGLVLAPTARELMERPQRYYSEAEIAELADFFNGLVQASPQQDSGKPAN